jgi:DNA-binding transcriptional MerR regulator
MTLKLFRAMEVCELAQLQPYVLRSWENEFPGIGVQKAPDAPRLYRQSDVDQVLRIKQLVFSEGLTLAGARRRLEATTPRTPAAERQEVAEVLDALTSDARTRIAYVRDGLRSILQMLAAAPGTVVVVDMGPEPTGAGGSSRADRPPATVRALTPKGKAAGKAQRALAQGPKTMAKVTRPDKAAHKGKAAPAKVVSKASAKQKRSRASA